MTIINLCGTSPRSTTLVSSHRLMLLHRQQSTIKQHNIGSEESLKCTMFNAILALIILIYCPSLCFHLITKDKQTTDNKMVTLTLRSGISRRQSVLSCPEWPTEQSKFSSRPQASASASISGNFMNQNKSLATGLASHTVFYCLNIKFITLPCIHVVYNSTFLLQLNKCSIAK